MREVSIVGIGQTAASEHWERSLRDLAVDAIQAAFQDAHLEKVDALYVGNMLSGELAAQQHLGTLIADWAGLGGIEAMRVEAGDASGAAALRVGYTAVSSAMQDTVLVCGVEKTTDADDQTTNAAWSAGLDAEYEAGQGLTMGPPGAVASRGTSDKTAQDGYWGRPEADGSVIQPRSGPHRCATRASTDH